MPAAWTGTTGVPPLAPGRVDVWLVSLDQDRPLLPELRATLAPDELDRASRLRRPDDRDLYVLARGLLRTLLGASLGLAPPSVRFTRGVHGRPELGDHPPEPGLHFNVSHSGGLALVALAPGAEVGVDVERVTSGTDTARLADRFFAPAESEVLRTLAPDAREGAFYRWWTCKEAFVKALGRGLAEPLDRFELSLGSGDSVALLSVAGSEGGAAGWTLRLLPVGHAYAAAVAVRSGQACVRTWRWLG